MTRATISGRPPDASSVGGVLRALPPGTFPGCSYAISARGILRSGAFGHACLEPEVIPAGAETLFDLASLTKPLCTALLALNAWDRGELDLHRPVVGVTGAPFTPMDLLRHEAGFPPWRPLYGLGCTPGEVRGWLLESCPRGPTGARSEYSCLGYILMGFLLEETLGADLPYLFRVRVGDPLGLRECDAGFNPPRERRHGVAATELGGESEAIKAGEFGTPNPQVPGGGGWGVVGDGNARFLGGAAGNAGLFATARATAVLAAAYLSEAGFLSPMALRAAWSGGLAREGEIRTAGWKRAENPGWIPGAALSPGSVGHDGYTGTGAYLDRDSGAVLVLLTNRTHPRHPGTDFGPTRGAFLRAALTGQLGEPGTMVDGEARTGGVGRRGEAP